MSKSAKICLYFTGAEHCWAVMSVEPGIDIDYYDIVHRFLQLLNAGIKRAITMADVTVYSGTIEMQRSEAIDLSQKFWESKRPVDLIVDMNGGEEPERTHSKVNYANLVEIGKKLFDEKKYKAAVSVFQLTGRYGLPYILKVLAKAQSWQVIASTGVTLIREFRTDVELMEIFAESFENIGRRDYAFVCYHEVLRIRENAKTLACLAKLISEKRMKFLDQAAALDDKEPEVVIQLAKIAFSNRNYTSVLELVMREPSTYKLLAQFCHMDCDFSDALMDFMSAQILGVDTCLSFADVLYKHGAVYEALGITKRAVDVSKMDFVVVLRYLYYLTEQHLSMRIFEIVPGLFRHLHFRTLGKFRMSACLEKFVGFVYDDAEMKEYVSTLKGEVNPRNNVYLEQSPEIVVAIAMLLLITFAIDGYYEDFITFDTNFTKYYDSLRREEVTDQTLELYLLYQGAALYTQQIRPCSTPILALGDQMAAAWGGALVHVENRWSVFSHPIHSLSILKLGMDPNISGKTVAFWDAISTLTRYDGLVLMLGTYDCEMIIPKYVNKLKYNSVERAVVDVVSVYCRVVDQIKKRYPATPIFVHPAIPRRQYLAPIVHEFNRVLREHMPATCPVLPLYESMEGLQTIPVTEYGMPCYTAYDDFQDVLKTEFLAEHERIAREKLVCKKA